MNYYKLDEHGEPVQARGLMEWAAWFEDADRIVKQENIAEVRVSTVFLGLDHNYTGHGAPILWETMVFRADQPMEQERCSGSREQAEAMHDRIVKEIEARLNEPVDKQ